MEWIDEFLECSEATVSPDDVKQFWQFFPPAITLNPMEAKLTSSLIRAVGHPEAAQSRTKILRRDLSDMMRCFPSVLLLKTKVLKFQMQDSFLFKGLWDSEPARLKIQWVGRTRETRGQKGGVWVTCCCLVPQSCLTLCCLMGCSKPVLRHLPESAQTHVLWVPDAIQPAHPLSSSSPPALYLSQHQGLFQWVFNKHSVD